MQKVSQLVRSQADTVFQQKKPEKLQLILKKIAEQQGLNFEDVLNTYLK